MSVRLAREILTVPIGALTVLNRFNESTACSTDFRLPLTLSKPCGPNPISQKRCQQNANCDCEPDASDHAAERLKTLRRRSENLTPGEQVRMNNKSIRYRKPGSKGLNDRISGILNQANSPAS